MVNVVRHKSRKDLGTCVVAARGAVSHGIGFMSSRRPPLPATRIVHRIEALHLSTSVVDHRAGVSGEAFWPLIPAQPLRRRDNLGSDQLSEREQDRQGRAV